MKIEEVPDFGNLSDVTCVYMGINVACPFGAQLLAEQGAHVIAFENATAPESTRCVPGVPWGFFAERRNMLAVNGKLGTPEGNELFCRLMKKTDILMVGSKGGAMDRLGLSDETLWEYNPQLVIVHVSGFGQTGNPDYIKRPSFDGIAQAFGGLMAINGEPGSMPLHIQQMVTDYYSALYECWAGLAALIGARRTGKGESVDVSQFECAWKCQFDVALKYFGEGEVRKQVGSYELDWACSGPYQCGDGEWIEFSVSGHGPIAGLLEALDIHDPELDPMRMGAFARAVPAQARVDDVLKEYCMAHDSDEVQEHMLAHNVPCSRIYDIETIQDDPHVQEREVFVEWEDDMMGTIKGLNVIPKMKVRPGKIWKGAPLWGEDNVDIYSELGYTPEELDDLAERGIITPTPDHGGYLHLDEKYWKKQ